MASTDTLELATLTALPQSTSTVYLSSEERLPTITGNENGAFAAITLSGDVNTVGDIDNSNPGIPRLNESSLPPMDGGFHAWSYVRHLRSIRNSFFTNAGFSPVGSGIFS
jgi:hypothetical protein